MLLFDVLPSNLAHKYYTQVKVPNSDKHSKRLDNIWPELVPHPLVENNLADRHLAYTLIDTKGTLSFGRQDTCYAVRISQLSVGKMVIDAKTQNQLT